MGFTAGTATAVAGPIVGLTGYATPAVAATAAAAVLAPLLLAVIHPAAPAGAARGEEAVSGHPW